jgi:flagellum-specific peptidoglycan hydrolase FlgJ
MGYTETEAKNFIKRIAPLIVEEAKKRGYPIRSTAIAQAIVEGAAGTSTLAKLYHNHFGMKATSSYKGDRVKLRTREEYVKGKLVEIYADFRAYPNDEEGISGAGGYYDFLKYKRYNNLHYAKDYRQYAEYLKKDGWATSSTYVETLIKTVKKYDLMRFDSDPLVSSTVLKRGDRGDEVVKIQLALYNRGYDVGKIDGIFGQKTEDAVRAFQADHKVKVDGIVGTITSSLLD